MKLFAFDEIDTGRIANVVRESESSFLSRLPQSGMEPPSRRVDRLRFRNDYTSTIPAWGVIRVTGVATVESEFCYTCDRPDSTYRWLYMVNGHEDVTTGKIGWGTWLTLGTEQVLYDTGATPAFGQRWGPQASSFLLGQHRPGFFMLGGTAGSGGTARVFALQIPPGEVRVQNDDGGGSFAAGATGRTFGIYGGTAGTTDTGLEVTLNNGSSTAWAATKYGWATADAGGAIWGAPHQI